MDYLPLFCQLRGKTCLLVGGGDIAERKARLLLKAGANLQVCALRFSPQFQLWQQSGDLTLLQTPFAAAMIDGCWLVIAATDDEQVNQRVSAAAETRRVFCSPECRQRYYAVNR